MLLEMGAEQAVCFCLISKDGFPYIARSAVEYLELPVFFSP